MGDPVEVKTEDANKPTNQVSLSTVRDAMSGPLKDYMNPKVAITLGASAAMVLTFTTTLCASFPILPAAIVALFMSFVFGGMQVAYIQEKMPTKIVYGLICSMLIFHSARGGNMTLGDAVGKQEAAPPAMIELPKTGANFSIVPSAYADTSTNAVDTRLFFSRMQNGQAVYTNTVGVEYIDKNFKQNTFSPWTWKK